MEDNQSTPTSNDALHRAPGLLVRDVGDEILILDTVADQIHQLNVSASLIWRLAESGLQEKEVAEALEKRFDISHDQAVRDTEATLRSLRDLRLLGESKADRQK